MSEPIRFCHDPACPQQRFGAHPFHEGGAGRAVQDDGLPTPDIERLQAIQDLQPNAVAYMRQRGYVMDVVGPLPDDAPELDRWKVLAFSLYTDLVQASTIAEQMLTEAYRGAAPPLHDPQEPERP